GAEAEPAARRLRVARAEGLREGRRGRAAPEAGRAAQGRRAHRRGVRAQKGRSAVQDVNVSPSPRPDTLGRMWIIGLIIAGLIVGALGRLFHPGRDPMGLLATIGIGIASVIVAGLLIGHHGFWTFLVAVLIGVGLVALVGRLMANRGQARTA